MTESHYVETYHSRHFPSTVEIWCPTVDETKAVIGDRYLRYCPMCGESIDVEE